ncbi:MAG: ATP-dependent DNA helicase DinG [Gammaproteobacteria bacterium]|nr:ATP-dependent DNA helicase DinG [Gammaproteobacteria bacterium]
MLADDVKDRIQNTYRQLLNSKGLTPRYGQRQMIAEIAKTLAVLSTSDEIGPPICVVEAGTGTGKTLAYLLAVLPLAQELGYKVVVSTATVALQEQVILKDIPEIIEGSDLEFSFALAKGRARYLCLSKLDMLLAGSDSLHAMMDLYGEELDNPNIGDISLCEDMVTELSAGNWQGDRDDWKTPISEENWRPLTVDRHQCTGSTCSNFHNCCFYKARNSLDKVDCIVSNHDMVLTDLVMGGGAILPEPGKCIYIFDEAHHLSFKSNNHFSSHTRIKSSLSWLEHCEKFLLLLAKEGILHSEQQALLQNIVNSIRDYSETVWIQLEQTIESSEELDKHESKYQYTFELGVLPEEIKDVSTNLSIEYTRLVNNLKDISDELRKILDQDVETKKVTLVEQMYPILGINTERAESNLQLWSSYARKDPIGSVPTARWLTFIENEVNADVSLFSSPVLAAENLKERLWGSCGGAVLTSATLSALGEFEMLRLRTGLPEQTNYLSIPSPFDFGGSANFVVPRMNCEPADTKKHTDYIVEAIPKMLTQKPAALILFSSRTQMNDVMRGLPSEWLDLILCQDDYQKIQLLTYHRQRIDRGEGSIIFGLASFAEGVDLPGKYCTHVLIAKIPFAVPTNPIDMTLSAWIEKQGQNAFLTLSVPDAAFRLVQASGRLLRSETDRGRITLFDERIINKRYGKAILNSMPPYRLEIFQE